MSKEKIKAVSNALMAEKSRLDKSPIPARINLPEVARAIGEVARRPIGLASPRSSPLEDQSISLDPTRVKLPEGALADGSKDSEPTQETEVGPGKSRDGRPSGVVEAGDEPTRTGRASPLASVPLKAAVVADPSSVADGATPASSPVVRIDGATRGIPEATNRPEERTVSVDRSSTTGAIRGPGEGRHSLEGAATTEARPEVGPSAQPDPPRIGGAERSSDRVGAPAKVAGRPQDGEGVKVSAGLRDAAASSNRFAGVGSPEPSADSQTLSSNHAESSMTFVRNPLSTGLRDFSMSGPTSPVEGGSASDRGGIGTGPVDPAPGGSASPQGGASSDLSRTNELLQQLIDAVRKQRGSSLPTGGPSVYPDR